MFHDMPIGMIPIINAQLIPEPADPAGIFSNTLAWWSFRQLAGLTVNMSDEIEAASNQANPGTYDMDLSAAPPMWEETGLNGSGCAHFVQPDAGVVTGLPQISGQYASTHIVHNIVSFSTGDIWTALSNRLLTRIDGFSEYSASITGSQIADTAVATGETHGFSGVMDPDDGLFIALDDSVLTQEPTYTAALGTGTTFTVGYPGFNSASNMRVGEVLITLTASGPAATPAEIASWYNNRLVIEYPGIG